jgi:predicted phage tail protein
MAMKKIKRIRGAGGGGKSGGGGAQAVEATDSLHSKQFANVVDLLSEGPIFGLVDGVNSVYLNETPLAQGGVFNFKDVGINWTLGTQQQLTSAGSQALAAQYGFDAVRYPNPVNVTVFSATPVVRTLNNANTNTIVVTLSVPTLLSRDDTNGNTNPSSINLRIELQSAGAGYVTKITDTINGKTTSKYQRSYKIDVSGPGPWDIRVTKLTADSTSQLLENTLTFDDFTGIISTKLTYPNSALVASSIDSQQFQAVPVRGFDIKGLLVKIPSNYDPIARTYTGSWDGTFSVAWTDNPAWCFYDMLTNSRYGLGDLIDPTQVDKWGLYTIAQYCDVMVPSGVGAATEPRFTCNLYLQSPAEAYAVVQNMASIFRAITFWSTGSITVVQDSPASAAALFTNANVIDGAFNYTGVSIKARHTVAQVTWNDPADFYRQKIEYVQDDDGVKLYGVKRAELVAFGCTSRGQANRLGKWLLYSEKAETETVVFKAGLDGFQLYPGAIIKTSDTNRAGQRMGGRIVAATTTTATLDAPATIATGHTYSLSIIQPDGTIVKTAVTSAAGTSASITFTALAQAPQVNSVFIFEADNLVAETWRIIGVSQPEHHLVEVTAVKHDPTKFAQIELGQKFDTPVISALTARPASPANLAVRTSPYTVNGTLVGLRATLSWQSRESRFKVRWRQAGAIWNERTVTESTLDIDNIDYTSYEFQVYAINNIGRESDVAVLNQTLTVPPTVLPALTGLALEAAFTTKQCKIKWNACPGATSYGVEVRDTAGNTSRRIVNVGNSLRFDYTSADMRQDGGPWRALTFYVTPLGNFGSAAASPGTLAVSNPQVGAINGVNITGGLKTVFVSYTTPADADFVGVQVWLSTTAVFTPDATTLVYDGNDSLLVFRTLTDGTPLVGGTTYYAKIAGYDDFGKDSLTYSGSIAVTPAANAPDINSITAAMLQASILDNTKFASGFQPFGIVSVLPAVSGYTGPPMVLLTTDNKLYRLAGGAWTKATDGADILLNSIGAGSVIAASLTAREFAAKAITTDKLAVGDFSNLCNNPDFEAGDIGWIKSNFAIQNAADGANGPQSGNWFAVANVPSSTATLRSVQLIPVKPSDVFYARAYLWSKTASDTGYLRVVGYDKNGGSETVIASTPNIVQGGWTQVGIQTASPLPTNITTLRVEVVGYVSAGGTGGFYADQVGIFRVSDSTLIGDGAVLTRHVATNSLSGNVITVNTLTGDRVVVNSLTGDRITVNSLNGNTLIGNTVQADKLLIGGRNLIPNSGPAPGTTAGYTVSYVSGPAAGPLQASQDPYRPEGGGGVYIQPSGTPAAGSIFDIACNYNAQGTAGFPATAGKLYEASAYLSPYQCAAHVKIQWYNNVGTYLGESAGNDLTVQTLGPLSNWNRSQLIVAAPPNTAFASVHVRMTANGAANPAIFCSNWYFSEALPGQTVASPWSASASTTIDGAGIRTGSLTADKITTASLSVISPTIGTLRQASSGQRMELMSETLKSYDTFGTKRAQFGDLSIT